MDMAIYIYTPTQTSIKAERGLHKMKKKHKPCVMQDSSRKKEIKGAKEINRMNPKLHHLEFVCKPYASQPKGV